MKRRASAIGGGVIASGTVVVACGTGPVGAGAGVGVDGVVIAEPGNITRRP